MFIPEARRRFRLSDAATGADQLASEVKQQIDQAALIAASNLPQDVTGTPALSPDEAAQQAIQSQLIQASELPVGGKSNMLLYAAVGIGLLFFMSKRRRR